MDIKKILFVTKFNDLFFDAVDSLMDLTKISLDHIVFLNVIEREKVALRRGTGYQKTSEIKLKEMANIRFINWAETLFERGLEVGAHIVIGDLVKQVISAAEKENVDLIVVGHEKRSLLGQLYPSSDILEIIRRSHTPIMVYKYKSDNTLSVQKPFARPLLATSFSETTKKILGCLKNLNPVIERLRVVHVANPKSLKESSVMGVQTIRKEIRRKLDELCDILIAEGIDASPGVYIGNTTKETLAAVKDFNATMIITEISSRASLRERLIGSTSRLLIEKSIVPNLLIPSKK